MQEKEKSTSNSSLSFFSVFYRSSVFYRFQSFSSWQPLFFPLLPFFSVSDEQTFFWREMRPAGPHQVPAQVHGPPEGERGLRVPGGEPGRQALLGAPDTEPAGETARLPHGHPEPHRLPETADQAPVSHKTSSLSLKQSNCKQFLCKLFFLQQFLCKRSIFVGKQMLMELFSLLAQVYLFEGTSRYTPSLPLGHFGTSIYFTDRVPKGDLWVQSPVIIIGNIRSIAENSRRSTEAYRRVMSTWPSMMVGTAEGDLPKLFSPALLA